MAEVIKLSDKQIEQNQYDLTSEVLRFVAYMNNVYGINWREYVSEATIDFESTNFWKV